MIFKAKRSKDNNPSVTFEIGPKGNVIIRANLGEAFPMEQFCEMIYLMTRSRYNPTIEQAIMLAAQRANNPGIGAATIEHLRYILDENNRPLISPLSAFEQVFK